MQRRRFFTFCITAAVFVFLITCGNVFAQDEPPAANGDTGIVDDVIKNIKGAADDAINPNKSSDEKSPVVTAPPLSTQIDTSMTPPPGIPGIVAQGDNATLPQVPEPPPTYEDHKTVILRALDKVTARTKTLEVPVGQQFNFGALTIAVRACRARPPLEPPDAAAFLQIVEQKPGEPMIARFSGWMFASKPSLSALEHPVYDVWVVSCGGDKIEPAPPQLIKN